MPFKWLVSITLLVYLCPFSRAFVPRSFALCSLSNSLNMDNDNLCWMLACRVTCCRAALSSFLPVFSRSCHFSFFSFLCSFAVLFLYLTHHTISISSFENGLEKVSARQLLLICWPVFFFSSHSTVVFPPAHSHFQQSVPFWQSLSSGIKQMQWGLTDDRAQTMLISVCLCVSLLILSLCSNNAKSASIFFPFHDIFKLQTNLKNTKTFVSVYWMRIK